MKPATAGERELLELVLREVRHAVAEGRQLEIIIDPHTVYGARGKANVCFMHSMRGWSTEVGGLRWERSRRRKSR